VVRNLSSSHSTGEMVIVDQPGRDEARFCEQEAKLMEMAMIFGLFVGVGLTLVLPALAGMRHRERPSGSA
jgi:hypothetical protein